MKTFAYSSVLALATSLFVVSAQAETFDFYPKLSYYHHTAHDRDQLNAIFTTANASDFDYFGGKVPFESNMYKKITGSGKQIPGVTQGDYIRIKPKGTVNQAGAGDTDYNASAVFTSSNLIHEWSGRGNRFQQVNTPLPGKVLAVGSVPNNKRTDGLLSHYFDARSGNLGGTASQDDIKDFSIGASDGPGVIVRVPSSTDTGNTYLFHSVDARSFSNNTNGEDAKLVIEEVDAITGRPKFYLSGANSLTLNEGATQLKVYRDYATNFPCRVKYTFTPHNSSDFDIPLPATSGWLEFPGGTSTDPITSTSRVQTIPIRVKQDNIHETNETFSLKLEIEPNDNPNEAYVHTSSSSSHTYNVTIPNDDPVPTITFSGSGVLTPESGTVAQRTATVTLQLSNPTVNNVSVLLDATPASTATSGSDYTWPGGQVFFPAGTTSKTFNLTVTDDSTYEGETYETISLSMDAPTNATRNAADRFVISIDDDEEGPQVSFSSSSSAVNESHGIATIPINLDTPSNFPTTVNLTIRGSAKPSSATYDDPVEFIDALYIDGPLGLRTRALLPSEQNLSQSEYSQLARDFALSTEGWSLTGTSDFFGPGHPSHPWTSSDGSTAFTLESPTTDSQNWEADFSGYPRKILCFHTDGIHSRANHDIGEPAPFGKIVALKGQDDIPPSGATGRFIEIVKNPLFNTRLVISEIEAFELGITPDDAEGDFLSGNDLVQAGNPSAVVPPTTTQLEQGDHSLVYNGELESKNDVWTTRNDLSSRSRYMLDLGRTEEIGTVRVFGNRGGECCEGSLENFTVNIYADDGNGDWGELVSSAIFGGTAPNGNDGFAELDFSFDPGQITVPTDQNWGTYGTTKIAVTSPSQQYLFINGPLGFKYRALAPNEQGQVQDYYSEAAKDFSKSVEGWNLADGFRSDGSLSTSWNSTDGRRPFQIQVNAPESDIWGFPAGTTSGSNSRLLLFHIDSLVAAGINDIGEPAPFGIISGCSYSLITPSLWSCPVPDWGTYGILPSEPTVNPNDYVPFQSQITIPAGQTSANLGISIIDNDLREASETIRISIESVVYGTPGSPNSHTITILDDDLPEFAENTPPDTKSHPVPDTSGWPAGGVQASLPIPRDSEGNALPSYTPVATWRIKGEPVWRMNGTTAPGLSPGQHTIEFRTFSGLLTPAPITFILEPDGNVTSVTGSFSSNLYKRALSTLPGSLTVALLSQSASPPRWKLEGETPWRASGVPVQNLPAGKHRIVLETIAGFTPIGTKTIKVASGENAVSIITYTPENSSLRPTVSTLTETESSPTHFCGQLETSTGFATGVVVQKDVVLTTAHALFDAEKLVYTNHVDFYHQRHQDEYVPSQETDDPNDNGSLTIGGGAHSARAWFVLSGYAAERADGTSSSSTPRAQYLDVGAVLFNKPVARGGKAGVLESTQESSEWLVQDPAIQTVFNKTLIGYPVEKTEYTHLGKLHASAPTPIGGFVPVVGGEVGVTYIGGEKETITPVFLQGVYSTPELISSGGMSGGGLFVEDDGTYRLSAIYLGESGASGVFRAIDGEVIDLIDRVANLTDNSSGSDGYDSADTSGTTSEYLFEELTVGLGGLDDPESQPPSWRVVGNLDDIYISGDTYELIGRSGEDAIVFNPVPGYLTPAIQHITINDFENPYSPQFHIYAEYIPDFQAVTAGIAEVESPPAELLTTHADLDGDGASNLLEWASGLDMNDPKDARSVTPGTGTSGLPHISLITNEHGARKLRIEYLSFAPELAPHVSYICEFSNDLETWIPVTSEIRTPVNSNWHRVIVDDAVSINDRSKRYARVRVTYTPPGE